MLNVRAAQNMGFIKNRAFDKRVRSWGPQPGWGAFMCVDTCLQRYQRVQVRSGSVLATIKGDDIGIIGVRCSILGSKSS